MTRGHRGQVHHERPVADREARHVVPAAADGDREAFVAGDREGRDHVVLRLDEGDDSRPVRDHAVPDLAGILVPGVTSA